MRFRSIVLCIFVVVLGCGDLESKPEGEPNGNPSTEPEDDPTFQCQTTSTGCTAPTGATCCPITAEPGVDCSFVGGTADPGCFDVCDGSPESFEPLVKNDDGCWVWEGLSSGPVLPAAN